MNDVRTFIQQLVIITGFIGFFAIFRGEILASNLEGCELRDADYQLLHYLKIEIVFVKLFVKHLQDKTSHSLRDVLE